MFKKIPGNNQFEINVFGKFKLVDGVQGCTPVAHNGFVNIELYGKIRLLDVTWLSLIAYFEVFLPKGMEERIMDVNFVDTDLVTKKTSNKMMVFNRPMVFNQKYRIIPCFTRYAISKQGEIIEIETLQKVEKIILDKQYTMVNIYDPELMNKRQVRVHRLLATAWIPNDDYFAKPVVNHIDGNKQNYNFHNLEWVSYSENSLHAVNIGLREDNKPCKVYDVTDGSVYPFPSVRQACKFMGIREDLKAEMLLCKIPNKLISKRFQLKYADDNSEWFYDKHKLGTKAGVYTIFVEKEDGIKEEHADVRTFKKVFGVWNVSNINDLINKASVMYPKWKFSYEAHYTMHEIQAYHLESKTIVDAPGGRQMARKLKVNYNGLRRALIAGETRTYGGYAFRYKTNKPWNTNFTEYECKPKCILAIHKKTDEKIVFESERKAATYFNVERSVIRRVLRSGSSILEFKLKYEDSQNEWPSSHF
jgi:hypothetical protein